ncbi:hypothetical protein [Mangrovihabitans endophyticus]|uniref:hypothetical protein n=1 Tax=Mangrovihabitans endophyticus TaxID=1751298 RepID=UPI0016699A60|nr:hypothetical protein [Mangrovihabitans endophyticus]
MSGAAEPLGQPGRDLARRNRRVLAERLGWPSGILTVCEEIDDAYPAWSVTWHRGGGHDWAREGYYAMPRAPRRSDPRWLYGSTPAELRHALAEHTKASSP